MNIIIVDDEKDQRASLKRGLLTKGYGIYEAVDGMDALKCIHDEKKEIGLVLTDFAMPGMNGMELLKHIRASKKRIPVIMMTAYGEKGLVIDAMRNECDGFIEKPFTLDELTGEIKRVETNVLRDSDWDLFKETVPRFVHQINNPLTSIMGMAELGILRPHDGEAVKKRMGAIIDSSNKIREINEQMLRYGRSLEEKKELIDISDLLGECLKMFSDLLVLKDISVEKSLGKTHPSVSGSRFGLEQVFKNLIANAIDAIEEKHEKTLRVKIDTAPASPCVDISIEDTGCGISSKDYQEIFQSYFTTKARGTGLGLGIVQDIIRKHKGGIDVRSQVGKGTRFKVTLPTGDGKDASRCVPHEKHDENETDRISAREIRGRSETKNRGTDQRTGCCQ